MNEAEWLACDDPRTLPYSFLKQFDDRKLRLCAVAACRVVSDLLCEAGRSAVDVAERMAEGLADRIECERAAGIVHALLPGDHTLSAYGAVSWALASYPASQLMQSSCWNAMEASGQSPRSFAELLRDIVGNPFRPVTVSPLWRTSTVVALARQMYEDRDFGAMPILADALQDAGCDNDEVLRHCRDAKQVHVRGCWVVDLVLDRK
jgi:hypothetical protein